MQARCKAFHPIRPMIAQVLFLTVRIHLVVKLALVDLQAE